MNDDWEENFYKEIEKLREHDLEVTRFADDNTGCSIIGNYQKEYKDNSEGILVPFSRIYVIKDSVKDEGLAQIIFDIHVTRKVARYYDSNNEYDYVFSNLPKGFMAPINIVNDKNFFVSLKDGMIYERAKKGLIKIDSWYLYERFYNVHISSVYTFTGLYRRLKMFALRTLPSWFFIIIALACGCIFFLLKGQVFKYSVYDVIKSRYLGKGSDTQERRETQMPEPTINFFGYKVATWTVGSYSLVVVLAGAIFQDTLQIICPPNNSAYATLSTAALAIFSIIVYDRVLPKILKCIVKKSSEYSYDIGNKGVLFHV
ncbi:MAG: hypothetical protein HXL00_01630 [Candidatus Nanosynbacter sp.]|nr:hypothetical protein [Candidatus Nanosynbacter sp.]